jgi:hypothetical protein
MTTINDSTLTNLYRLINIMKHMLDEHVKK